MSSFYQFCSSSLPHRLYCVAYRDVKSEEESGRLDTPRAPADDDGSVSTASQEEPELLDIPRAPADDENTVEEEEEDVEQEVVSHSRSGRVHRLHPSVACSQTCRR